VPTIAMMPPIDVMPTIAVMPPSIGRLWRRGDVDCCQPERHTSRNYSPHAHAMVCQKSHDYLHRVAYDHLAGSFWGRRRIATIESPMVCTTGNAVHEPWPRLLRVCPRIPLGRWAKNPRVNSPASCGLVGKSPGIQRHHLSHKHACQHERRWALTPSVPPDRRIKLSRPLTGCEFQTPQKCLRLISVYAINFMP
jgi:hypothetical protein